MTTLPDTTVEQVETWYLRVPLATPIALGSLRIAHRDFVIVRVRTVGGAEGVAYSLTRGAPLDLVLTDVVAPLLVGKDALDIPRRLEEMTRGVTTLGPVGLVGRAISLLDIAMWDIKGHVAGLPVHRLLGGYRTSLPMMLVAPYAGPDEDDTAYADRLVPYAARGYHAMKLYPLADPAAMTRRLTAVRAALGDRIGLVIDMAWSWRSAAEGIAAIRQWEDFGLLWVEDPFPSSEWRAMRQLSDGVRTPIGAGDEVSVEGVMEALITERAVDIVRLDATSIGGFTRFGALSSMAGRAGFQVAPHAYAEIHQHVVFAWPEVSPVEVFAPGSPTWGTSTFMTADIDLPDGASELPAPTAPGIGIPIDWPAVETMALRRSSAGSR